ncbi:MAG: amylo-alpha-1,6-glucosidase [Planctomycetota bacterium]
MDKNTTTHPLAVDGEGVHTDTLLQREWLLTNGTGAFSMGTALGCNTRRYHGLLIAAASPPVGRVLALNQVFDQLILKAPGSDDAEQHVELGSCLFRGDDGQLVHAPQGHQSIAEFKRGLAVQWTYQWGKVTVERELVLHDKAQAITIHYRVAGLKNLDGDATLRVAPMLTLRDFHSLLSRGNAGEFALKSPKHGKKLTVTHHDSEITFNSPDGKFTEQPDWWHGITYPRDAYRGQGDREDYFIPGHFNLPLSSEGKLAKASITVALGSKAVEPKAKPGRATRIKKSLEYLPELADQPVAATALAIAADDFVVQRTLGSKKLTTIMAGYPWFADWGRDTFIALPGLLLSTGRLTAARDTLRAFASSLQDGLVPNRFDDYTNEPHYNTVDASLWYVVSGLAYIEASETSPKWLVKAMTDIVDAYAAGTNAQGHDGRPIPIAMDADGLIAAGDDHSQLTWMDAACGGTVFTPRPGKCVEINALWYHALVGLAELLQQGTAKEIDAGDAYAKLAKQVKRSFVSTFWSDDLGRLIDHVRPDGTPDLSLRPNMVFACSLPNSPLPAAKRKAVLAAIKDQLLTSAGLRTLPADDPNYHPHYVGPQYDRDKSYHQGTVWPWPMGAYAEGVLRAGKFSKKAKAEATAVLQPLVDRLLDQGLGQLHEIFDAEAGITGLHEPRGCPAQAWSVAEVVRVLELIETS